MLRRTVKQPQEQLRAAKEPRVYQDRIDSITSKLTELKLRYGHKYPMEILSIERKLEEAQAATRQYQDVREGKYLPLDRERLNSKILELESTVKKLEQELDEKKKRGDELSGEVRKRAAVCGITLDEDVSTDNLNASIQRSCPKGEQIAGEFNLRMPHGNKTDMVWFDWVARIFIGFLFGLCLFVLTGIIKPSQLSKFDFSDYEFRNALLIAWVVGIFALTIIQFGVIAVYRKIADINVDHVDYKSEQVPKLRNKWLIYLSLVGLVIVVASAITLEAVSFYHIYRRGEVENARATGNTSGSSGTTESIPPWLIGIVFPMMGGLITLSSVVWKAARTIEQVEDEYILTFIANQEKVQLDNTITELKGEPFSMAGSVNEIRAVIGAKSETHQKLSSELQQHYVAFRESVDAEVMEAENRRASQHIIFKLPMKSLKTSSLRKRIFTSERFQHKKRRVTENMMLLY